jgi:hypothetical protein
MDFTCQRSCYAGFTKSLPKKVMEGNPTSYNSTPSPLNQKLKSQDDEGGL